MSIGYLYDKIKFFNRLMIISVIILIVMYVSMVFIKYSKEYFINRFSQYLLEKTINKLLTKNDIKESDKEEISKFLSEHIFQSKNEKLNDNNSSNSNMKYETDSDYSDSDDDNDDSDIDDDDDENKEILIERKEDKSIGFSITNKILTISSSIVNRFRTPIYVILFKMYKTYLQGSHKEDEILRIEEFSPERLNRISSEDVYDLYLNFAFSVVEDIVEDDTAAKLILSSNERENARLIVEALKEKNLLNTSQLFSRLNIEISSPFSNNFKEIEYEKYSFINPHNNEINSLSHFNINDMEINYKNENTESNSIKNNCKIENNNLTEDGKEQHINTNKSKNYKEKEE